jgi:hypothetical protein
MSLIERQIKEPTYTTDMFLIRAYFAKIMNGFAFVCKKSLELMLIFWQKGAGLELDWLRPIPRIQTSGVE